MVNPWRHQNLFVKTQHTGPKNAAGDVGGAGRQGSALILVLIPLELRNFNRHSCHDNNLSGPAHHAKIHPYHRVLVWHRL